MKSFLGNLLLTAGTILGGLAAANSAKVWRTQSIAGVDELPGQYLFVPASEQAEAEVPHGTELTAEVVAQLQGEGRTSVPVLDPPRPSEPKEVPAGDASALVGSVLHAEVVLPDEQRVIEPGQQIDVALMRELEQNGVETAGRLGVGREEGGSEVFAVASERIEYSVPALLEAGTFIDADVAARLGASGLPTVEIRVVRPFSWNDWEWKWHFLGGVVLMLGAIFLKRSAASSLAAAAQDENGGRFGPEQSLRELCDRVSELNLRKDELDAVGLHTAVGPLLEQYVQPIIEGREDLQARLGVKGFARVMSPFAAGERKLNRVWSAAVDGHAPEARASLEAAVPTLAEARDALPS